MIKNITFLRHYKLEYPYDDKANMNLEEYKSLTEGTIDPNINSDIFEFLIKNFNKDSFNKYEIIFTSDYLRTKETAESINNYFSLGLKIEPNRILNEIPSRFIRDFKEKDYLQIQQGNRIEKYKERVLNKKQKIKRLKEIDKFLQERKEKSILIISHSYLIGQLNYFYNIINRNTDKYSEIDSEQYEIGGYLQGFSGKWY